MRDIRLTIGVPTQGKRPDRLSRAVASALGQSVPTRVLVSYQGDEEQGRDAIEPFIGHPLVRVVNSPAQCLWENWVHSVESCDTELFAWLQDDDVISPHFTRRVISALDRHPLAVAWIARLGLSFANGSSCWWNATGPMVPMDLLTGGLTEVDGLLMAAGAYFSSFALSPAVAFRWSLDTVDAVRRCPKDSDLFNERTLLAELGRLNPIVCDPAIVGYWCQHENNESRAQTSLGLDAIQAQYNSMARRIDAILTKQPRWVDLLRGWLAIVGREVAMKWFDDTAKFAPDVPTYEVARVLLAQAANVPIEVAPEAITERPCPQPPELAVDRRHGSAKKAVTRG